MKYYLKTFWNGLCIRVGILLIIVLLLAIGMFAPKQTLDFLREYS